MAHGSCPWATMTICCGGCIHHWCCCTFATETLFFVVVTKTRSLVALVSHIAFSGLVLRSLEQDALHCSVSSALALIRPWKEDKRVAVECQLFHLHSFCFVTPNLHFTFSLFIIEVLER